MVEKKITGLVGLCVQWKDFVAKKQSILNKNKPQSGRVAEANAARRLSGRPTVLSGGGQHHDKGDIEKGDFLIEVKSTVAESLRVEKHWLDKITYEATQVAKTPALMVQFVDRQGNIVKNGSWVLIKESTYVEVCQERETT